MEMSALGGRGEEGSKKGSGRGDENVLLDREKKKGGETGEDEFARSNLTSFHH